MYGWNTTFLLGSAIFRGYVCFREGKSLLKRNSFHGYVGLVNFGGRPRITRSSCCVAKWAVENLGRWPLAPSKCNSLQDFNLKLPNKTNRETGMIWMWMKSVALRWYDQDLHYLHVSLSVSTDVGGVVQDFFHQQCPMPMTFAALSPKYSTLSFCPCTTSIIKNQFSLKNDVRLPTNWVPSGFSKSLENSPWWPRPGPSSAFATRSFQKSSWSPG